MKQIRLIEWRGPEFGEWLQLRDEVLRKPLGLQYSEEDIAAEKDQFHLCLFIEGRIAAGLILQPLVEGIWKMRQVAVHPDYQRKGLGGEIVRFSEAFIADRGGFEMKLHARELAVPFYLNLGYEKLGEPFTEVGLTHYLMRKQIPDI